MQDSDGYCGARAFVTEAIPCAHPRAHPMRA